MRWIGYGTEQRVCSSLFQVLQICFMVNVQMLSFMFQKSMEIYQGTQQDYDSNTTSKYNKSVQLCNNV